MSKDGAVSFTQMSPHTARVLLDLATDLAAGQAVLLYSGDGQPTEPTDRTIGALRALVTAYDKPTTPPVGEGPWDGYWRTLDTESV